MDSDAILQRLRAMIAHVRSRKGGLDPESIALDSELGRDAFLDSVEFIACLVRIEDHFQIRCDKADYKKGPLTKVSDLIEIVRRRSRNKRVLETAGDD